MNDDFQIYSNPIFLMFDIENKIGKQIHSKLFTVYLSKDYFIEFNGKRLYVPIQIKTGIKRLKYNEYIEIINFIPAFEIQLGSKTTVELTIQGMYNCTIDIDDDNDLKMKLREENGKLYGIVGGDVSEELKSILTLNGFKFTEIEGNIVIEDKNLIITKQSIMILPPEFDKFDVICEDIKTFYTSINTMQDDKQGSCKSIGYYLRKNGNTIDQHSNHHRAIIDKNIYDMME